MQVNKLKQTIRNTSVVRKTALDNARKALEDCFEQQMKKEFKKALKDLNGYSIQKKKNGTQIWKYDKNNHGDVNAKKDIEKSGLIILDEGEDWFEVISPERMAKNINTDQSEDDEKLNNFDN